MLATLLASAALAAAPFPQTIPLPVGWGPEGLATGKGTTFYAGSRVTGAVYRGDLRTGKGTVLVPGQTGRQALGLKARGGKLYVAGGMTGFGYVYDARTGANIAAVDFDGGFVNDVTVTRRAAYFTDSFKPLIYVYDRRTGATRTLPISGDLVYEAEFNANGIAATPNGKRLIIVQSNTGELFTANPRTGATKQIDAPDVSNGDGILLRGKRLYVVRNTLNQIAVLRLRERLSRATLKARLTDPDFDIPTTIARHGKRLYVVNARFDQDPPTTTYDVVQVG
jgi:DNA-binding beta-propeller fold protein YncE